MRRIMGALALALAVVMLSAIPYTSAFAETGQRVEASGAVTTFNGSPHSGVWAAEAMLESDTGSLVSIFRNGEGDIFIVTVRGSSLVFDGDELTITGTAFVARNGALLKEGDGTGLVSQDGVEIRVNGDVVIYGWTASFALKG